MKRVLEFIRSVIPADPWQLLYLAGAVFLFLSPRLNWLFEAKTPFGFTTLAMIPVVIAGIFAYYGCFQPGEHPLRRIALAVFLPAVLGFCLLIGESTFFDDKNQSIFVHRLRLSPLFDQWTMAFKEHPTGFSVAVIALGMLGAYAIRMYLGISSLPLCLSGSICCEEDCAEGWNRMQMLIFVLVCPLFLLYRFSGILFSIPTWLWHRSGSEDFSVYVAVLEDSMTALLFVLVAILILGKSGKESARSSVRLPDPRFALFGLALPALISLMISTLQFGYDRVQWATHDFGRSRPPQWMDYFSFGNAWRWSLVLMVFAAFAEEIVFRGMLLRPLLRRYGLHRGIFFTGLIWAAFHFHGEMHQRYTMEQALLQLASRIAICLAMNCVLSWMTLRWKSVIPAAIAHTASNVLLAIGINGVIPFAHEMRIVLWAVCALVLFRYWPVKHEDSPGAASVIPSLENAV